MSTNDVPGHNPANLDALAMGAWAEHEDGSLILVESNEGGRVIYSIFDISKTPIVEFRDAMPEVNFKREYSWDPARPGAERWTWHDKTPFPWDRVIKEGARDGVRYASARDQLTAAERVAEKLRLRGEEYDDRHDDRRDREMARVSTMMGGIQRALDELPRNIAREIRRIEDEE
jgi:hypothetical protein